MTPRHLAFALFIAAGVSFLTCEAFAQRPGGRERGRHRTPDKINEGDTAPDFTLKSPDGKQTVTLSSFRGKRPVALVFGSYT